MIEENFKKVHLNTIILKYNDFKVLSRNLSSILNTDDHKNFQYLLMTQVTDNSK